MILFEETVCFDGMLTVNICVSTIFDVYAHLHANTHTDTATIYYVLIVQHTGEC